MNNKNMEKSVGQKAVDFAGNRSLGAGHGYPNYTANLLEKGFLEGHKSAEKEFKEKLDKIKLSNEDTTKFGDGFEHAMKLIYKEL